MPRWPEDSGWAMTRRTGRERGAREPPSPEVTTMKEKGPRSTREIMVTFGASGRAGLQALRKGYLPQGPESQRS